MRTRPIVLLALVLLAASSVSAEPIRLNVSPDGPVKTLKAARDALRAQRQAASATFEGAVVEVAPGSYALDASLVLGPEDGGTPAHPVVWRAAGQVTLSGGRAVPDWRPVTDPAVRARLPQAVRDRVITVDLRAAGISDFGQVAQRGNPGMEIFVAGQRMPLARFPNDGWLLIADVPQTGPRRFNEGLARERRFDDVPVGRHYGRITYPGDRPSGWAASEEILLHGYWTWDWSDSFQRIASIDTTRHEITLAEPHHHYGYTRNQRFRFLNVLEEIDEPGEWTIDRARGTITLLPPAGRGLVDAVVSVLDDPLVRIEGAAHLRLEGFTFETSRGSGVVIRDGDSCVLAGCTFRNLGGEAVTVQGGRRHRVQSCDLHDLANGAIRVAGGDRASLTVSGHEVVNNHIHRFSQWLRTGQYGVMIDGVGQRVAHNLIHDAPFEAMYLRGNDHLIEFNEVHHVCLETGDAGAIHTGRDYTWQGNRILHNYWHHLKGPGLHGVTAVYLDDFSSGFTVHGNVFFEAGRGVQLGGGRDNIVTNNLFLGCEPAVHLDARGLGWASNYFSGEFTWLFDRFAEVEGDRPPYSIRYPALRILMEDAPPVPKGNRITGNISAGRRWCDLYDFFAYPFHEVTVMRDNLVADPGFVRRRAKAETAWDPYYLNIDGAEGYRTWGTTEPETIAEFPENILQAGSPGTFDPVTLAFTPSDPAQLVRIGFDPLPVHLMGLQIDEWRHEVPGRQR